MMDETTKAIYLRAAEALERHIYFNDIQNPRVRGIATAAFNVASVRMRKVGQLDRDEVVRNVDIEAARLLRECVDRNEELTR